MIAGKGANILDTGMQLTLVIFNYMLSGYDSTIMEVNSQKEFITELLQFMKTAKVSSSNTSRAYAEKMSNFVLRSSDLKQSTGL